MTAHDLIGPLGPIASAYPGFEPRPQQVEMVDAVADALERKRPLLVVGGPRFDEAMAGDLGVDRVFARGTTPGEVASYLVHRIQDRKAS